jgi:[ribosomal protein S18]-alanine N-acetyltransferase
MPFQISPLSRAAALAITRWRYPPPYDAYDIVDGVMIMAFLRAQREGGYYELSDGAGELVAFCGFGADARVPGGDYSAPELDLGLGVRPDLTGQGEGMRYLTAVLDFARGHFGPQPLRLSVAAFNQRAIRLYTRAGFVAAGSFSSPFGGERFLLMRRPGG